MQRRHCLRKILDFEPRANLPMYSLPIPKNKSEAVVQGTNVAEQERKRLSMGIGSIADITILFQIKAYGHVALIYQTMYQDYF